MKIVRLGLPLALATATAMGASAQSGNQISVPVEGLRNSNGSVRCGLYASAATFPKAGQEFRGVAVPIAGQKATCVFNDVPAGTYAVAVFHAEKNETQMQTNFFGQPKEGYGFSRNPSSSLGAPAFNDAAYTYSGGTTAWPVKLTY